MKEEKIVTAPEEVITEVEKTDIPQEPTNKTVTTEKKDETSKKNKKDKKNNNVVPQKVDTAPEVKTEEVPVKEETKPVTETNPAVKVTQNGKYTIEINGPFISKENAEDFLNKILAKIGPSNMFTVEENNKLFHILNRSSNTERDAVTFKKYMLSKGFKAVILKR